MSSSEQVFGREKREPRTHSITVRLTAGQHALLVAIGARLGMEFSEIGRAALDHWIRHGPDAAEIAPLLARPG